MDENKVVPTLKRLISVTINWLMLNFAKELTTTEKIKLYLKLHYRKLKISKIF